MIGWFSQVKRHWWIGWQTIGKHTNGYGEYEEEHLDHPLSDQSDAICRCHEHAAYNKAKCGFATYHEISI